MRIFAGDRVKNLMDRMGMPDDEPIEHPWVTKSVENAQRKVEERNFDIRKNTLEYDDVMNAQRRTMYNLRQQLGLGRYTPEELDELGKPTGKTRVIPVDKDIAQQVTPLVAQLVSMFTESPRPYTDEDGKPRAPTAEELDDAGKIESLEELQHEAYHLWGVKLDLETRKSRTARSVYDELSDLVVHGLSDQQERLLDLIDRVCAAITEEACPSTKLPEDWNWKAVRAAYQELFSTPLTVAIEQFGDANQVVTALFEEGEKAYLRRKNAMGVDLVLRVFRHLYTQAIDQAWVDHLQNMEHLRDGIGLRGYGQKDPKNEYKKEGYNLFLNMMANVSSKVLERLFELRIEGQEQIENMERAAEEKHQHDLERAVARHVGETTGSIPPQAPAQALQAARQSAAQKVTKKEEPKVNRHDLCPCGSGKKFKECHGAAALAED